MFTKYVLLVKRLFRRSRRPGWSSSELLELEKEISALNKKKCEVIKKHKSSNMKSTKWHMLDHVVYNLKRLDDMTYMMVDLYEVSHMYLKRDYERTSKRPRATTKEMF